MRSQRISSTWKVDHAVEGVHEIQPGSRCSAPVAEPTTQDQCTSIARPLS